MNYKKVLNEKIEKAKKLVEEFKEMGVHAILDKETGEMEIHGIEFDKAEVRKRMNKI